ncbi:3-deoxy-D-manno-octulosonic acid kinase [Thalassomonas viridans]|uniref:3-deoxy-D-manno-octulosonic acid kinase n=1 Tax=Thalassomonas viridans TaxID=137584 RepID=A0AAE9Z8A2_9GAMM|nr:3-deoxy-D-manno-octulosonic acid kinase [Thalassomonas viridans]
MVKPCREKVLQQDNLYCVFDEEKIPDFSPEMLGEDYWLRHKTVDGTARGRGTTWFVSHNKQQWVLRHYYRGGLIGKFNKDSYWFTGQNNTRAAREYSLLLTLEQLGLPAPQPVAYRVIRKGLFYRADLLSTRIKDAEDLVGILSRKPLDEALWPEIGATIRRFHDHGIYHHDLNIHNILLDQQSRVFLIDFDRGEQRTVADSWQQANMERLLRSFRKELNKIPGFHWREEHWQLLQQGYLKKT